MIRLISTCQQVEECLLSRANCISQPVDVRVLSPGISAYSAAPSVPASRFISACHVLDHCLHSCMISDHCLLSCMISAYSAVNQPLHSRVIIGCQPLYQNRGSA